MSLESMYRYIHIRILYISIHELLGNHLLCPVPSSDACPSGPPRKRFLAAEDLSNPHECTLRPDAQMRGKASGRLKKLFQVITAASIEAYTLSLI